MPPIVAPPDEQQGQSNPLLDDINSDLQSQPGKNPLLDDINSDLKKTPIHNPLLDDINKDLSAPVGSVYGSRFSADRLSVVTPTAGRLGLRPEELAGVIDGESGFDTTNRTGQYHGLAQLNRQEVESAGMDWTLYQHASADKQLAVAEKHWLAMGYKPEYGLKGIAMIQAAPAYLKKAMAGWDGIVYRRGSKEYGANKNTWAGPDGEIRPSSITAYYQRRATGSSRSRAKGTPGPVGMGSVFGPLPSEITDYRPDPVPSLGYTPQQLAQGKADVAYRQNLPLRDQMGWTKAPELFSPNEKNIEGRGQFNYWNDLSARGSETEILHEIGQEINGAAGDFLATGAMQNPMLRSKGGYQGVRALGSNLAGMFNPISQMEFANRAVMPSALAGDLWETIRGIGASKMVDPSSPTGERDATTEDRVNGLFALGTIGLGLYAHASPILRAHLGIMVPDALKLARTLPEGTPGLAEAEGALIDAQKGIDTQTVQLTSDETGEVGKRLVSADGHTFTEVRVPTGKIGVLQGLQYKVSEIVDFAAQVSAKLKGVTNWDSSAAGIVSLWKDNDGNLWALNGHHRVELANRLGVPDLLAHIYDEADGITKDDARAIGAIQNLREGDGTAVDAAGVMRDLGYGQEEMDKLGISLQSGVARDTAGLIGLPQAAFDMVRSGQVSEPIAAIVGKAGMDDVRALRTLEYLARKGVDSRIEAQMIVDDAKSMTTVTRPADTADLFGEEMEDMALAEKAHLSRLVTNRLMADERLYKAMMRGKEVGATTVDSPAQTKAAAIEEFARQVMRTDETAAAVLQEEANNYAQQPSKQVETKAVARITEAARAAAVRRLEALGQIEPGEAGESGAPGDSSGTGVGADQAEPAAGQVEEQVEKLWQPKPGRGQLGGTSLFGGRKGSIFDPAVYKDLPEKLRQLVDKVNSTVGGGIKGLQRLDPETADAFARYAAARQAAHTAINDTVRLVDKVLGKGKAVSEMFPALMQGRLYALRIDAATRLAEVRAMSVPNDSAAAMAAHARGETTFEAGYPGSNAQIKVRGFGADQDVLDLISEGRIAEAKQIAINALERGIDPGNDIITREEYNRIRSNPNWTRAVVEYADNLEAEMADWHALHSGWKTEVLGEDGVYIPLVHEEGGQLPNTSVPYKAPKNMANRQATGTSVYTADPAALESLVSGRFAAAGKDFFLSQLNKSGLVREATDADMPGARSKSKGPAPKLTMKVNGVDTPAVVRQASPIMMINKKSGAFFAPAKGIVIPESLAREVEPVLSRLAYDPSKIVSAINKLAVTGYAEPIFHFFGGGDRFWTSAAGRPVQAAYGFFKNLIDYNSQAMATKRSEMARLGIPANVRPAHLGDPEGGPLNGWYNPFRKIVFGDRGTDAAMRMTLYDIAKSMYKDPTPQQMRDFVNQMGTYVYGLDSAWERGLKRSGFNPFATAAKSQLIAGAKSATGTTAIPGDSFGVKALYWAKRQAFGGSVSFVAAWAGLHMLMTGETPWDKKTPFGYVPLGGGKWLNLNRIMPTNAVGFKITGISGFYNSTITGASAQQTRDAIIQDILNEGGNIVTESPTLHMLTRATLGREPVVELGRDRKGGQKVDLLQTSPGGALEGSSILYAFLQSNPITGNIATEAGFTSDWKQRQQEGETWLDRITDMSLNTVAPGMFVNAKDTEKQELFKLNQQEELAKAGFGPALSDEQAKRLAGLRAKHADESPAKKKVKKPPDNVDTDLKDMGRTQSGSKRKSRGGSDVLAPKSGRGKGALIGMRAAPKYRWDAQAGDLVAT